jgi:hypothetical protein
MPRTATVTTSLIHRATRAVEEAATLDKAIGRLAGVLYPTFYPRRVDVGMRVSHDRLVICGLWSAQPTRLKTGTVLRTASTGFPDLVEQKRVVLGTDSLPNPCAEALEQEDIHFWVAVPIPSERNVEGGLGFYARTDVFKAHREFFALLGVETGQRLAELARQSKPYVYERESLLALDENPGPERISLSPRD